jgi:hypothetical protein
MDHARRGGLDSDLLLARFNRFRVAVQLVALSAGLSVSAPPIAAHAQDVPPAPAGGMLVGTVFDSTSAGPLQGAAVYLLGTSHVAMTDADGAFVLPGLQRREYTLSIRHARLDSIGIKVAPTWQLDLPGTGVTRVSLAIPLMSTLMPGLCNMGDAAHRGIAVGTVQDAATGTVLPQASVEFSATGMPTTVVETDAEGRYVVCGLPSDRAVFARATFFRRAPALEILSFTNDQPVFQSFGLEIFPGVLVRGRLVDQVTSEPVSGAVVTLESSAGPEGQSLTDAEGRFRFDGLDLNTYLVEVEHLAYGKQMKWFTIADVEPLELELGLVPEAIKLDALVVNVRAGGLDRAINTGTRRDFVGRVEIERLQGAARNVGDLVRTMPGVRVQNVRDAFGQMRLCIEGRRSYSPGCDSVLVVIDGLVSDAEMLEDLPTNIIESIEFIPAVVAGIRYGGRAGSGVLEITTMR